MKISFFATPFRPLHQLPLSPFTLSKGQGYLYVIPRSSTSKKSHVFPWDKPAQISDLATQRNQYFENIVNFLWRRGIISKPGWGTIFPHLQGFFLSPHIFFSILLFVFSHLWPFSVAAYEPSGARKLSFLSLFRWALLHVARGARTPSRQKDFSRENQNKKAILLCSKREKETKGRFEDKFRGAIFAKVRTHFLLHNQEIFTRDFF